MIKTVTCIVAACDICGALPENDTDGYSHFQPGQESDALSEAESQDWWTTRDTNSVLCDARDEAHLSRAREILAKLPEAEQITFLTYWPELDPQGRSEPELLTAYRTNLDAELATADTTQEGPGQ